MKAKQITLAEAAKVVPLRPVTKKKSKGKAFVSIFDQPHLKPRKTR